MQPMLFPFKTTSNAHKITTLAFIQSIPEQFKVCFYRHNMKTKGMSSLLIWKWLQAIQTTYVCRNNSDFHKESDCSLASGWSLRNCKAGVSSSGVANTQTMTYQPSAFNHKFLQQQDCKKPNSPHHFHICSPFLPDWLTKQWRITGQNYWVKAVHDPLINKQKAVKNNLKIFTFCRFHLAISDINTPNFVTKINPCVTAHGVIRWWQQHLAYLTFDIKCDCVHNW